MQNLKIRVNNEAENREVQDILFSAGKTHDDGSTDHYQFCFGRYPHFINCEAEYISASRTGYLSYEEITLPELRAMAYPIKEYLEPLPNGEYKYHSNASAVGGEWIKIPEGAIRARFYPRDPDKLEFENAFRQWWYNENQGWLYYTNYAVSEKHSRIVWQRATHPEELPFIDDQPKYTDDEVKYMDENGQGRLQSINDQYAEIEQVRQAINKSWGSVGAASGGAAQASGGVDATLAERQSQYGCYEDVAHVTQQILSALRVGNYDELPAPMKESLHMIASKMARIVNGDPEYLDNWHDIGGYAKLIEKLIKGE